jgi:predicted RNA-binding protein YlxR (DUF448 family)
LATRTCAICRGKAEKQHLLRFVAEERPNGKRSWTLDIGACLPGRGIYLHPEERCLRSRKLERALSGLEVPIEELFRDVMRGEKRRLGRNGFTLPGTEREAPAAGEGDQSKAAGEKHHPVAVRPREGGNAPRFSRLPDAQVRGRTAAEKVYDLLGGKRFAARQQRPGSRHGETGDRTDSAKDQLSAESQKKKKIRL